MCKILRYIYLLVPLISFSQSDSSLNDYIGISVKELCLNNSSIDSLLLISIDNTNNSKLKNRVVSYSMYMNKSDKGPDIFIRINTHSENLANENLVGFFCKGGYKIYCFGKDLIPIFLEDNNSKKRTLFYKKPESDTEWLIDSNLIDERKILSMIILLNGIEYNVMVETVP